MWCGMVYHNMSPYHNTLVHTWGGAATEQHVNKIDGDLKKGPNCHTGSTHINTHRQRLREVGPVAHMDIPHMDDDDKNKSANVSHM